MGSFSLPWKVTHTHSIYKRWLRYFVLQKAFLAYRSARRKFLKKHLWNSLCLKKDQVQAFPIKHLLCMSLMFNKEQSWINRKRDRDTERDRDGDRQRESASEFKRWVCSAQVSHSKFHGSWQLDLKTLCQAPARCQRDTGVMGCRVLQEIPRVLAG